MVTGQLSDSESDPILSVSIRAVASVDISLPTVSRLVRCGKYEQIRSIKIRYTGEKILTKTYAILLARNPLYPCCHHRTVLVCNLHKEYFFVKDRATYFLLGHMGTHDGYSIFRTSKWWRLMVNGSKWGHISRVHFRHISRISIRTKKYSDSTRLVFSLALDRSDSTLDVHEKSSLLIDLRDAC